MKVLILVEGTAEDEAKAAADFAAGTPETKAMMAAMGDFNDELRQVGVLKDVNGLRPSRDARRVRFEGASRTVTGGPFTGSKDIVCDYWIWELPSIDEAIARVRRCPNPMAAPPMSRFSRSRATDVHPEPSGAADRGRVAR